MIKRLARYKIYVDRARWYMVFVQFIMIVIIFLQSNGINLHWGLYPLVVLTVLFIMVIIGFIDRKMGMIKEEQRFYSTENPIIQEILRKVNES